MAVIELTNGGTVLVDDADAAWLGRANWYLHVGGYAHGVKKINGRWRTVYMHREIVQAPPGSAVDHINGNKLDNRKENLRIVSERQNQQNRRGATRANRSSGIRGVTWEKRTGKWMVYANADGKQRYGGVYDSLDQADAAAKALRKSLGFAEGAGEAA